MLIIPVIDLLDGRAVHARRGRRHLYQPVSTPLCRDPDPLAVAAAYRSVYPFTTLYLADLDAIEDKGDNDATVQALRRRFRGCEFWLDAGRGSIDRAAARLRPVIGTETGLGMSRLGRLLSRRCRPVLSLDFRGRRFLGDREILDHPEDWPADVIIMNLARVGSGNGPDLEKVAALRRRAPGKRLYAGGGLRDEADLRRLAEAGAGGVLAATALHERTLDAATIARWSKKKTPAGAGACCWLKLPTG